MTALECGYPTCPRPAVDDLEVYVRDPEAPYGPRRLALLAVCGWHDGSAVGRAPLALVEPEGGVAA